MTIDQLPAGTYSVELLGIDTDLGGELVSEYGISNSVTVVSDQTSNAVISFGSFLPVIDPTLPAQTSEFAFDVDFSAVPTATGYFFELDTDPSFSNPTTLSTTGTNVIITVVAPVANWMRVRAENNNVPAAQAKPSDPVLIDVVVDVNPTGDDNTGAPSLGVGRGANGQYGNYNIYPATDEDWFAIDLTTDATLTVDVLTESLTSPPSGEAAAAVISAASGTSGTSGTSPLDPQVDIYDPSLTVIATNDDRDGTTVESRVSDVAIPVDGRYFIRVTSFGQSTVGHYELLINVTAEPVTSVTVDPTTATILPSSTVQLTGRTFDIGGGELFGREAIWSTSDGVIASVDGSGLVTGQSLGTATITFSSENISATATITVSSVAVAKVVITPTSATLRGIGQSANFTAEARDATDTPIAGKIFNWYTSNTNVADATDGRVDGVGNGQTVVVAETDGIEGYALVTVTDPSSVPANYWSDGPASGVPELLYDIWGTSSTAMYAVGAAGRILYNDGTGWTPQTSGVGVGLRRVWGVDEFTVWAVGSGGTIVSTGDMGANWTLETTPTGEFLQGVWGAAINDVFAVGGFGGTGVALHYDGTSWNTMPIPVTTALTSVWGSATDDVFAVGDAGVILHYDGASWTQMSSPTTEFLRTVWGTSNDDVFAVGTNGTIVHYDGLNWTDMTNPAVTIEFLRSVWGTSSSEVIAVGGNGTIVQYDGISWTADVSGTTEALFGVFGLPNPGILAVGGNGTVRLGNRGATADITASPTNLRPDGISTSTITVQIKDAIGTDITSGGGDIVLSTTAGTLTPVIDNGDGSYTATLTSSLIVETATITGTMNGQAIVDDATVDFVMADPAQTTITGSPTSIPADGGSTSTVTAQLADAADNPLTFGGDAVTLATNLGALGLVTDNGDGTYSAILTAGVTPGFATISGTVNAVAVPTAIVTIRGTSPPDLIGSTSGGGGPGSGGTNPSALYSIDRTTGVATPIGMIGFNRVGAMDVHPATGILYAAAQRASDGTAVLITIDQTTGVGTEIGTTGIDGAISDLSFHSDGTLYGHFATGGMHSLYTFNTSTGLATLIGLTGIGGQGSGMAFNGTNSLFLASSSNLYALETATGSGPNLGLLTYSNPSCSRVKAIDLDPATGVFYAALECGATDELSTLEITDLTVTSVGTAVAELDGIVDPATPPAPTSGPASELTSTITAPAGPIDADGVATAAVTVQLVDATSTALTIGGDYVTLSTTLGSLSAVTDNGNGTYSATLTSGTTDGTATISGTVNGAAITDNAATDMLKPWTTTGSMAVARRDHTATLLNDGTVLVVGWVTLAAELYDPVGGAFGATVGTPTTIHGQGLTATKLLNGKVLIVGGTSASTTAELYDPATGLFSATGSPSVDHIYHTATLLQDGRVLVTGGQDAQPQTTAVAEIYDPATGLFTTTGSMADDRSGHAAALLSDGRVLVTSGIQTTTPGFGICLGVSEIWDPTTGLFTSTGSNVNQRCNVHAITVGSGQVLVVGANWTAAELYDPVGGTFSATGSMSSQHHVGTATLLSDGKVMVAGGLLGGIGLGVVEIYDPATGTFSDTGSLLTGRWEHSATLLLDGRVLVAGGDTETVLQSSAEIY